MIFGLKQVVSRDKICFSRSTPSKRCTLPLDIQKLVESIGDSWKIRDTS
jgi:hypothetical protein